ncbi:MAG: class I adenylate-forming enzyme family protein [Myxococcota bacterium]|nr:class I adenylate-forming enzyme family protein [Myxococcota bacterium]
MYEELREAWSTLTAPGGQFEIVEVPVRGQTLRAYKNAPPDLRALWQLSAAHGDKDYLVYGDERWTFERAHREVASIASWLLAHGVAPGDRVAIAMRNYPEWLLSYWACTSVGIAAVGVNAWWTGPELAYGVQDSDPKVIIADAERLDRIAAHAGEIGERILVGVRLPEERDGIVPFRSLCDGPTTLPEVEIDPDADACIFYTSGTTGRPKGAQLTHRGCVNNVVSMAFSNVVQAMAVAAAKGSQPGGGNPLAGAPSALVVTPLFHVTANNCVAQSMTLAGGKLVHMYKWDPAEALRLIEAEQITVMSGVPVMARELIAHPDFAKRNTSSLKTLAGGGAQLQPDLVHKIEESVETARPGTGYGMTETCGIITSIGADFFVDRPESVGPAMPCFETRIVDRDGNELAVGETGELCVRGAQVIKGYLNRDEATAETIEDGWLRTGDIARLDEDGFIYIVDRAKDMVLRGGENIYCAEVESAIFAHDAVAECTVFGVPDDRLGEEVGAAVVTSDTLGADELRDFLRARLAAFKVPRYIWFVDDALPRNANGKYMKRELREELDVADAS